MKRDKIRLYFLEILLLAILFIALFVLNTSRIALALILIVFAIITRMLLKKKKIIKTTSKEIIFLMIGMALLYVGLFFLLGFFFYNFKKQNVIFGLNTLYNFIIPIAIVIICSEVIRFTFLSQNGKLRIKNTDFDYSKVLTFINMVLIDLIIYVKVYSIDDLNTFMTILGFISFASISSCLFYNYYSNRFGIYGIIAYRLITVLYVYFIPIIPNMYIYFRSFLRMLYPYVMYLVLEATYGKTNYAVSYYNKRRNIFWITNLIIIMAMFTMLISCEYKYGIIVVGSGSMSGTINVGDAVLYKSYTNQNIKSGDIIIFKKNDIKLIHRVVKVESVNDEIRYYTKGDANSTEDNFYSVDDDIMGILIFRIRYIGIPTLWLNDLFNKK